MRQFVLFVLVLVQLIGCSKNTEKYFLQLESTEGYCTATQIQAPSGQIYILTAAHCTEGLSEIMVSTEYGRPIVRKVLETSKVFDLALLEAMPGLGGLRISNRDLRLHERVHAWTHGHAMPLYRAHGEYISPKLIEFPIFAITNADEQAKCEAQPKYKVLEQHGTAIVQLAPGLNLSMPVEQKTCLFSMTLNAALMFGVIPGSSGGALLDKYNEVVGVDTAGNSAGFSFWQTPAQIREFLKPY